MTEIQQTLLLVTIHMGMGLLFALLCLFFSKTQKKYLLLIFSLFFLATTLILFIPVLPFMAQFNWNWQGKFLTFISAVAFVYFLPFLSAKNAGFTFKVNKSVWLPFIILLAISIGYNIYENGGIEGDRTKEYLLFQLTMPGLSEEPVFRGVMLGLLNAVFVSRKKILGVNFGWGAFIQALIFGAGHAIYFDEKQHLQFYLSGFTVTFVLGIFITYLREKGESLIPALLFHNLFNASLPLIRLFV
jgi:uncharacterized protein